MKRITCIALALSLGLFTYSLLAADFWQAKLFTDWSDKEVTRIMETSPWAKQIAISMGGGGGSDMNSSGGKRDNRKRGGGRSAESAPG